MPLADPAIVSVTTPASKLDMSMWPGAPPGWEPRAITEVALGTDAWGTVLADAVLWGDVPGLEASLRQEVSPRARSRKLQHVRLTISGPVINRGEVELTFGSWPVKVECGSATLVQWASYCGYYEMLEALLRNGGSAKATSELEPQQGDLAPFLLASMGREDRCLRLLASHHADVNVVSPFTGYSALHIAAMGTHRVWWDHTSTLKTLIDLGVNKELVTGSFETALYIAVTFGDVDAINLLGAAGANVNTPRLLLHSSHGSLAYWYDSRMEVNSPFVEAVANNDFESMKALIIFGADTENKGTAWMQCAGYNDQVIPGNLTVREQLLPWIEQEMEPEQAFFAFLVCMCKRSYNGNSNTNELVAKFVGMKVGLERGRLCRARDAIVSGRVHARASGPWFDGAYYIQYKLQPRDLPPAGEGYPLLHV